MSVRLGIDASQAVGSCAVSVDGKIVAAAAVDGALENFSDLLRGTLAKASVKMSEIDEIVVSIGPGSLMGVRTAVVTGNALALALNKPISSVYSTDAAAAVQENCTTSFVSAGRRRWFRQNYEWQGSKLCRAGEVTLVDDLPENAVFPFANDKVLSGEALSCAYGALVIAEEQRHLLAQELLDEVQTPEEAVPLH